MSSIPVSADDIPDYEVYSLAQKVYNLIMFWQFARGQEMNPSIIS